MSKAALSCPFCKKRLNLKFSGFTCVGAVYGPYLKGNVTLECSDHKCPYRHSLSFKADKGDVIDRAERLFRDLVQRLPGLGPWETFYINEKGKRKVRIRRASMQGADQE
jgi:hypothetical protein